MPIKPLGAPKFCFASDDALHHDARRSPGQPRLRMFQSSKPYVSPKAHGILESRQPQIDTALEVVYRVITTDLQSGTCIGENRE
jgi:hypothetical protein